MRNVAYFSMEIGLEPDIRTYAGGLGVLAGDSLKTAADLELPMLGINGSFFHSNRMLQQYVVDSYLLEEA